MKTFLFRIGSIGPFFTVKVNAETVSEGRKKALEHLHPQGLKVWWDTVSGEEAHLCFDPTNVTEETLTLIEVDGIPQ